MRNTEGGGIPAALTSLAVLIMTLMACSATEPRGSKRTLYISDDGLVLSPGDTLRFGFAWEVGDAAHQSGSPDTVTLSSPATWQSGAPAVATISAGGTLTAETPGTAKISLFMEGLSDSATVTVRALVTNKADYAAVALGFTHACAITTDGRAWCWGSNRFGELGAGFKKPFTAFPSPRAVSGDKKFTAVASGTGYSCALETSGRLWCWGNRGGPPPIATLDEVMPTPVAPDLTFASVTAGSDHTCALTASGVAYCWGLNRLGQLGTGTLINSAQPVKVQTPNLFIQISAGDQHTCALTTEHDAYCWGDNAFGELGIGSTAALSTTPMSVTGNVHFSQVSAGTESTCAIADDFRAYCWGENFKGKLGTGDDINRLAPTLVLTTDRFMAVSSRLDHTCALNLSGRAFCWGDNSWGQLGSGVAPGQVVSGDSDPYTTMTPVAVNGDRAYGTIATGSYSSCGITSAAEMFCWGGNSAGELGTGRRRVPRGRDYEVTVPLETEPQIVRRP